MTLSGHVGHVKFYLLNVHHCMLLSNRVRFRVRVRISVWLVSCYAHVFVLYFRL